jgi:hypothetical protein
MPTNFYCDKCDFKCTKQSIYNKHLETAKHRKTDIFVGYMDRKDTNVSFLSVQQDEGYTCPFCRKSYKYHSGLWRHKSICSKNNEHTINNVDSDTDSDNETILDEISQTENIIIRKIKKKEELTNKKLKHLTDENREIKMQMKMMLQMMTTNSQFQSHMMDLIKTQVTSLSHPPIQQHTQPLVPTTSGVSVSGDISTFNNSTNSNNTNNSNNNTFNMNLFLNEKCKDAMNMKDFVNSIQLNMTDMENVGRLGYVEGMSSIFIDNLKKTDVYKRPVHCSDVKRETLYVKDNNQWERDGPDHAKMTNAVLAVEQKNVALLNEWAKANPRCMNSDTRENDKYFKLSKAVTDGDADGNIAKVIHKVAKRVTIEKDRDASLQIEEP